MNGLDVLSSGFLLALGGTVAALGLVVWSGVTRRRSLHYGFLAVMLATLVWAIREAEIMGAGLVFDGLSGRIHLVHFVFVAATIILLAVLAVTGTRLAKHPQDALHRGRHRRLGLAFVVLVLVTSALGTLMTLLATPIDEVGL